MKRLPITLTSILFLSSCSSGLRQPESFQQKMNRYQVTKYSDNKVPEIALPKVSYTKSGRTPASVRSNKEEKKLSLSNKRLYFLTLHEQYSHLNNLMGSVAPDLNLCPNFHTSLLKQMNTLKNNKSVAPVNVSNFNYASDSTFKPELYLPIMRNSTKPVVKDVIAEEGSTVVTKALEIHLRKTYSELQELCEFGNSDNYYTFENLYTLINMGKLVGDDAKVSALMKTTLFTNNILIKSLTKQSQRGGRMPASQKAQDNHLMQEVYKRFKSPIKDQELEKIL